MAQLLDSFPAFPIQLTSLVPYSPLTFMPLAPDSARQARSWVQGKKWRRNGGLRRRKNLAIKLVCVWLWTCGGGGGLRLSEGEGCKPEAPSRLAFVVVNMKNQQLRLVYLGFSARLLAGLNYWESLHARSRQAFVGRIQSACKHQPNEGVWGRISRHKNTGPNISPINCLLTWADQHSSTISSLYI